MKTRVRSIVEAEAEDKSWADGFISHSLDGM